MSNAQTSTGGEAPRPRAATRPRAKGHVAARTSAAHPVAVHTPSEHTSAAREPIGRALTANPSKIRAASAHTVTARTLDAQPAASRASSAARTPARRAPAKRASATSKPAVSTPTPPAPPAAIQQGRNDALDGLRALAIVAVVLYHARPRMLSGGFVGVTVFFVLAGYLSTRSIERTVAAKSFSYPRYLLGRLRRTAPQTLALIGITALLTAIFAPYLLAKLHADAIPAALFVSNWAYIVRQVPYFAAGGLPSPLTHLWYLAVYLQFIVFWPPLLLALRHLCPTRHAAATATCALALASAVLMALLYDPATADSTRVYYGLDTRAAELLCGAALALFTNPARTPETGPFAQPRTRTITGAAGLAVLATVAFFASGSDTLLFYGGYLLFALAAAAVVLSVTCDLHTPLARMLSAKPLARLGRHSFSLYLVHYPLILIMNPASRTTPLPWWGWLLEAVIILAATELFYLVFECNWKPGPLARLQPSPVFCFAGCAALVAAFFGLAPLDWDAIANPLAGGIHDANAEVAQAALEGTASTEDASESSSATDGDVADKSATSTNTVGTAEATTSDNSAADASGDAANDSATQSTAGAAEEPSHAEGGAAPTAEKVPTNLDPARWTYDVEANACNANALIIGDSVTDDARYSIGRLMPAATVEAKMNRQFSAGIDVYQQCIENGIDADVVIVALGGNGVIRDEGMVQDLIDAVGGKPLYFVTIRCPEPLQDENNELLRRFAAENDNVGIIDWFGESVGHDDWLVSDGQHLTAAGYDAYAQILRKALVGV